MILGNTLNGISLGMDRLGDELATKRDEVETLLALGATRWEAARATVQQAVRTGMIPTHQHDDDRRPGQSAGHDDRSVAQRHEAGRRR